MIIQCQQCLIKQELPDWLPFTSDDAIRKAFCSPECRDTWWKCQPKLDPAGFLYENREEDEHSTLR